MISSLEPASPNRQSHCHVCGQPSLEAISAYTNFSRVTSDCKPWPKGGRLFICSSCSCVQKMVDAQWESEIGRIYDSYSIYHQSAGVEQAVFDQTSGIGSSRSALLLERLNFHVKLPDQGKLLDVGCGNGAFLRAFSSTFPGWRLRGTELNAKYQKEVENIAGVEALHVGGPAEAPGCFDLITLVHVLEHVPSPQKLVGQLWDKLRTGGYLLIQVPAFMRNPFDLLIADHISHFTKTTILQTISAAGFEVINVDEDWVPKELTLVCRKNEVPVLSANSAVEAAREPLLARMAWLDGVVALAKDLAASGPLGLFGTSIAATWLFQELAGQIAFFIDEDRHRAGRKYMDRPVYLPSEGPSDAAVLVALPPDLAELVKARLESQSLNFKLVVPPRIPEAGAVPPTL
jgi:SAM-dependent methyltransferase